MENKQREITVEQVMYSLLGTMYRHRDDVLFNQKILCTISPAEEGVVIDAVTMGLREGYIDLDRRNYRVTDEGIDAYERATIQSSIVSDAETQFRDEVLSGTTQHGKQTPIERAALPSGGFVRETNRIANNAASLADANRVFEQFLAATGEDFDSVREGMNSGRIGVCRSGGIPHWGKFRSNGHGGFVTTCTRCERGNR